MTRAEKFFERAKRFGRWCANDPPGQQYPSVRAWEMSVAWRNGYKAALADVRAAIKTQNGLDPEIGNGALYELLLPIR